MTTLRADKARAQASVMAPTIYQRVKSLYDFIVPIHLDDFDATLIEKPVLYYRASQDADYSYALYSWFHWRDWSELPWPIKELDEHLFDFEGALFAWPRPSSRVTPWAASICHYEICFVPLIIMHNAVEIEAGGHGVVPSCGDSGGGNVMIYRRYDLINIDDAATNRWLRDEIQPAFNTNGVHLPWQWRDSRIGDASTGLIYSDPARLGMLAKKEGLLPDGR